MSKTNQIISEYINASVAPVEYNDISKILESQGLFPNKTTIYRNLEILENQGVIKKVLLSDQKQYWEKSSISNHFHFHLICELCKKIECREFAKNMDLGFSDFTINKTDFNLSGLCNQCQ